MNNKVDAFFAGGPFAVAGASNDRRKFGNKVLRCYWQYGRVAYPVNPREREVEGQPCYATLAALPERVTGVSLITQPAVSEEIVEQAIALGLKRLWFQPGSESGRAITRAQEAGIEVIAGGPCVLVELPRQSP
jgi:predicted CoA-binding protein